MLKNAGAERVSTQAVKELKRHLDRSAFEIADKAVKLAKHAKRKTVEAADVKLAIV